MKLRPYLEKLPFWTFRPFLRGRVSGLFLHDVSETPSAIIRHLYRSPTPEEFSEILEFLTGKFTFVPLSAVVQHYREGSLLPPNAAFLSVDDGYSSCRSVIAPILREAGVPATFFLTTSALNSAAMFGAHKLSLIVDTLSRELDAEECLRFLPLDGEDDELLPVREILKQVRRVSVHTEAGKACLDRLGRELRIDWQAYLEKEQPFLNDEEVRWLLSEGFEIGAHGVDHTKFSYLDETGRETQVRESVQLLCSRFGLRQAAFSFPNSSQNVSRDWMRRMLEIEPGLQIFVDTGGYLPNDSVLVNRLTLDKSLKVVEGGERPGRDSVSQAIKIALVREIRRR